MAKHLISATDLQVAVDHVASGGFLTQAARMLDINYFQLRRLINRDPKLKADLRDAREAGADALVSEAIEIVDAPGDPNRQRNQAQMRQWAAGKLAPRDYGDQLQVTVEGGLDLRAAMASGAARLRPVSDQQSAIDVESTVESSTKVIGTPDYESVVAENPDIFT